MNFNLRRSVDKTKTKQKTAQTLQVHLKTKIEMKYYQAHPRRYISRVTFTESCTLTSISAKNRNMVPLKIKEYTKDQ